MKRALRLTLLDTKEVLLETAIITVHIVFIALEVWEFLWEKIKELLEYLLDLQLELFRAIVGE